LLLVGGCGGSGMVPVRGTVTFDGAPLEQASLAFLPEGEGEPAHSMTKAGGAFELDTHDARGAKPGKYRVTVTKLEFGAMKTPEPPRSVVPEIYRSKEKTPLLVTLPSDGDLKLELKSH
jgi:hypothetical protein